MKYVLATVLGLFIGYLPTAYIVWQWDVTMWVESERIMHLMMSIFPVLEFNIVASEKE